MNSHQHISQKLRQLTALTLVFFAISLIFGVGVPKVLFTQAAEGPDIIGYQGRILNANGVPVTDSSLDMVFELHTAPVADTCVWSNSSATCASSTVQAVTLTDGLFSEELGNTGDGYASLAGIFDDNAALYLEVVIEGETLSPRKRILSAPYAINAAALNGMSSDDFAAATGDALTGAFSITQSAADTSLLIDQNGNTGATLDDTNGGALHITNTGNDHSAFTIYSNNGPSVAAPLVNLHVDNVLFDEGLMRIQNDGLGSGIHIVQNTVDAPTTGSIGNQALVIDVNEAGGAEDIIIVRSDADGTPDTEFIFQSNGEAYADGAWNASGADFAEYFDSLDATIGDHDLICSSSLANKVEKCDSDSISIVGVVSTNPAFVANTVGLGEDSRPLVGLIGQIETHVTNENGPIAVGDPLTLSRTQPGYAMRATTAGSIVGFALEASNAAQGTALVYVNPQWHAGALLNEEGMILDRSLTLKPERADDAFTTIGSASIGLVGRADGEEKGFIIDTDVASSDAYSLEVRNEQRESLLRIAQNGDVSLSGKLYLANTLGFQSDAYLSYDGGSDLTEGYIRTNAAGFSSESFDFAEMYKAEGSPQPGDIVVFANNTETVRTAQVTDSKQRIAGIVSTQPGFLAGKKQAGQVPVALSGRVPTNVVNENGDIKIGDPLTISSTTGHAMKATEAGTIVGYALESSSKATDQISVFVRASYFEGVATERSALSVANDVNLQGGRILNASSIQGLANRWMISDQGDFYTRGTIGQYLPMAGGGESLSYAALTRVQTIQLSGTAKLNDGYAKVEFEKYDKDFNNLISGDVPYQVFITPEGLTNQLYIEDKTRDSFKIREVGAQTTTHVDWLVIAYPKDYVLPTTDSGVVVEEGQPTSDNESESGETGIEQQPQVEQESEPETDQPPVAEELVDGEASAQESIDLEPPASSDEETLL